MLHGAKKIIFTVCHSGKLKVAFTSPDVISTCPRSFLTSRIDFIVLLLLKLLKKHHLPVGQVNNTSLGLSDTTFFARWCYPTFEQSATGAIGFPNAYPWIVIYSVDNAVQRLNHRISFMYTVSWRIFLPFRNWDTNSNKSNMGYQDSPLSSVHWFTSWRYSSTAIQRDDW